MPSPALVSIPYSPWSLLQCLEAAHPVVLDETEGLTPSCKGVFACLASLIHGAFNESEGVHRDGAKCIYVKSRRLYLLGRFSVEVLGLAPESPSDLMGLISDVTDLISAPNSTHPEGS